MSSALLASGSIGRRRMVGDGSGDAARGGGSAAGERVPALCFRSVGRGLARESGEGGRGDSPISRRSRGGIPASGGRRAVPERVSGAVGEVRQEVHPAKTRLIGFGRLAEANRKQRGKGKPDRFTFPGFTHYCGRNSKESFVVWRRTAAKRMRAKLLQIKQERRRKMHEPVGVVGEWLKRVVQGYYGYHAVPGNIVAPGRFRDRLCRLWRSVVFSMVVLSRCGIVAFDAGSIVLSDYGRMCCVEMQKAVVAPRDPEGFAVFAMLKQPSRPEQRSTALTYRWTGGSSPPLWINFCPWCGADLRSNPTAEFAAVT